MLRRSFIHKLLGVGALALLPKPLLDDVSPPIRAFKTPAHFTRTLEPWAVDPASKVISWTGASDKSFTVLELHRYLSNVFDDPDMMTCELPSIRYTDHTIELINDWTLSPDSIEHLYGGSMIVREDVYGDMLIYGNKMIVRCPRSLNDDFGAT